jgi:hypothetical protein
MVLLSMSIAQASTTPINKLGVVTQKASRIEAFFDSTVASTKNGIIMVAYSLI